MLNIVRSILLSAVAASFAAAALAADNVVMVELFTSQGCSSCPPADRNLARLAERDDVLALSMHVDYWDYLGWRDTFASPEHTQRQLDYRDKMGGRVIFTPQIVVHGEQNVPGYKPEMIEAAIAEAATGPRRVSIEIGSDYGILHADVAPAAEMAPCTIWVASYEKSATVEIDRGENAGRTMTYHNVVEKLMKVGPWRGEEPVSFPLPQPGPGEGLAVWLQDDRSGRILAASYVER